MPQPRRERDPIEASGRIVTGPDPDRFYCPHSGCNRSFAELWRLKVHFRAPPDIRGSGKERGHGQELQYCPKCGQELKPGKHHVGCLAGRSAPRQAAKRQKHSTTDTSDVGGGATSDPSSRSSDPSSWEDSYRRKQEHLAATAASHRCRAAATGGIGAFGHDSSSGGTSTAAAAAAAAADGGGGGHGDEGPELVFTKHHNGPVDFGLLLNPPAPFLSATNYSNQQPPFPGSINPYHPLDSGVGTGTGGEIDAAAGGGGATRHHNHHHHHHQQPFNMKYEYAAFHFGAGLDDDDAEENYLARGIPSPPPLQPDWDLPHNGTTVVVEDGRGGAGGGDHGGLGLLFDFDQFNTSARVATTKTPPLSLSAPHAGGVGNGGGGGEGGVPSVTISTAMNPSELSNPSENYVWQIMFASESDHVPKRVTAHLHNREPPMVMPQLRGMLQGDGGGNGGGGPRALQPTPEEVPLDFLLHSKDGKVNNNDSALEILSNGGDLQKHQQQLQVEIPPPPKEVMQAVVEQQAAQKVTVTYTVSPGEAGKPTYTVDSVQRIDSSNGVGPLPPAVTNGTGH